MADNFDMKKYLVENKLGSYSKLKEEMSEKNIEKLEDLADENDLSTLKSSLQSLISRLLQDGSFDEDDIVNYLTHLVKTSY